MVLIFKMLLFHIFTFLIVNIKLVNREGDGYVIIEFTFLIVNIKQHFQKLIEFINGLFTFLIVNIKPV